MFCFVLGCFPSSCSMLIWLASSGSLHHWRVLATSGKSSQPPPMQLLGASLGFSATWGDYFRQEISMASWTAQFRPYCLWQGAFLTLFVVLPLKELLGPIQAFAQLGIIFSCRIPMAFFQPSDQRRRLEVLSRSNYYSIWLATVSGSIFDWSV